MLPPDLPDPFRLLLVTKELPPQSGGYSRYTWEMARALEARGARIRVLLASEEPHPGPPPGLDVVEVDVSTGWLTFVDRYRAFRRARRAIEAWEPSAVVFAYPLVGLGRIYEHLADQGPPFVTVCHTVRRWERKRERLLRRRGLGLAARVIANSEWMRDALVERLGLSPGRVRRIYHGVDPTLAELDGSAVEPLRRDLDLEGRTVLLSVARLTEGKNIEGVIRVLPDLAREVPDVAYLAVGPGDRSRLEHLAGELGVGDRVRFPGRCHPSEVGRYYRLADVFILIPRLAETFGLVFAEANLCGLPTIGSRLMGIPEAMADRETGLLVDPDDPGAVTEACLELLRDPEKRRRMGRAGARRARELFRWDRAARELLEVLETCPAGS